jgi:hypothetical protein
MLIEILDNRPDVPTGRRCLRGHWHDTFPTMAVRWAEPDPTDPDRVIVTPAVGGGRANMSREAFRTTCYLAGL